MVFTGGMSPHGTAFPRASSNRIMQTQSLLKYLDRTAVVSHCTLYSKFSLVLQYKFTIMRSQAHGLYPDHINPLNPELNPIFYLLALLGAYHFLHVSRIRVKSLTLRLLMSYIYGAPILDVSRSHTTTHHSR